MTDEMKILIVNGTLLDEPVRLRDLAPDRPESDYPWPTWRGEMLAMSMRIPFLAQEHFEFLEDQAFVHLPNCPRLLDRHCEWCATEGVTLLSEVLRRERAVKDLIPTITRVTLP